MSHKLKPSGSLVAARVQASADRAPVIRCRGGALCGFVSGGGLLVVGPRLGVSVVLRADGRAGDAAKDGAETGIAWSDQRRAENRPGDRADRGAGARRRRGFHHHTLAWWHARAARIKARLLHRPDVAVVAVALELFGALPLCRIYHNAGWHRLRRHHGAPRRRRLAGNEQGGKAQNRPDSQFKSMISHMLHGNDLVL